MKEKENQKANSIKKQRNNNPNKKHLKNKVLKAKIILAKEREALSGQAVLPEEEKKVRRKKTIRIIRKVISWTLIAVLAAALVLFVLIRLNGGTPTIFGYSLQRVTTGSMSPSLEIGDIFISKTVDSPDEVDVGDIITFKGNSDYGYKNVTHRVFAAPVEADNGEYYLVTKGDANVAEDDPIPFSDVQSKCISKLGILKTTYDLFLSPAGLLIFIALLILVYFDELLTIAKVLTGNYNEEEDEDYREEMERLRAEEEKRREEEEERRREEEKREKKRKNPRKYDNTSNKKKKNRKKQTKKSNSAKHPKKSRNKGNANKSKNKKNTKKNKKKR